MRMLAEGEETFFVSARTCAQIQACRSGLRGDVADDFVQGFVVRWLVKPVHPAVWTWPEETRCRFLRRAARNHVIDLMKKTRREQSRETEIPWRPYGNEPARVGPPESQPETGVLRCQFWL